MSITGGRIGPIHVLPEIRLKAHMTEAGKRLSAEMRKQQAKNKNAKQSKAPKATPTTANGKAKTSKTAKRKPGRKKGPSA